MKNTLLATLVLTATAFGQGAGPLVPPGPPADGAYRTLGELWDKLETVEAQNAAQTTHLEPRTDIATLTGDADAMHVISASGSYYLSSNLISTKSTAIEVAVPNVTIDLNGFEINRVSAGGNYGIKVLEPGRACTIRNGAIRNFFYGIYAFTAVGFPYQKVDSGKVTDISVSDCSIGIAAGDSWILERCAASENAVGGISTGRGTTISLCTASLNTGYGFDVGGGSTIGRSASSHNSEEGIKTDPGVVVTDCSCWGNDGLGIGNVLASGLIITRCSLVSNDGGGIAASSNSIIAGCHVSNPSGADGILAGFQSTVRDCHIINGRNGITCDHEAVIRGCHINFIAGHAISVSNRATIEGNRCVGRLGSSVGILATGEGNRIEGNFASSTGRGFDVQDIDNFIVKNTASDNSTNYKIVAGNRVGRIVEPYTNFSAISGNSGGGLMIPAGLGTGVNWADDAWVNFAW